MHRFDSKVLKMTVSAAIGIAITLAAVPARSVEPIDAEQFERLHALIRPQAVEDRWLAIGWLTSLWEARLKAAAIGKPILLWEMDGHPLGCT